MRPTIFAFVLLLASAGVLQAQTPSVADTVASDTSYWDNVFQAGANFNQAQFSGNWKGGGISSVAFGGFINGKANYLKGKWSWDNLLDLQYGLIKNKGQSLRKSTDKLFIDSKVGYRLTDDWAAFGSLNFLSQFGQGFEYIDDGSGEVANLISNLFAPAYITTSLGLEYKPNKHFSLRIGAFSPRITIMTEDSIINNVPENYGVEAGKTTRLELVSSLIVANFNKDISKNINLQARYQVFSNFENFSVDKIDHRLDINLTAKVAKLVNVNLTGVLIDDKDQHGQIQWSQALSIGLIYKVANRPEPKK